MVPKFVMLALGLLGHAFVRGQETIQYKDPYTTSDYNYTPAAQQSTQNALSQYGAHFKHAFTNADTAQERVTDDPLTMSLLTGTANALYTTVGLLSVNSLVTNNCNKINEMLNVADLSTQTLTQGTNAADAGLTSTQTAITAIVSKINEIIQKGTLTC